VQKALGRAGEALGRLKADAAFSTNARTPAELREALALDGPFEVVGGIYQGVDLSRAHEIAASAGRATPPTFEELKGTLELRGEHVLLNQLCIRSPKLVAGGNVDIAPDKALSREASHRDGADRRLQWSRCRWPGRHHRRAVLCGPRKAISSARSSGTALACRGIGTSLGLTLAGQLGASHGLQMMWTCT
jgi:hypothetical protein